MAGIVRFVTAFSLPEGRGVSIALAILDVAAGIVILSWPGIGLTTLAVIIGIALILRRHPVDRRGLGAAPGHGLSLQ